MRWQYAILARAKRSLRTDFEIEHDLRMMERADLRQEVRDLMTENRALRAEVNALGRQLRGDAEPP